MNQIARFIIKQVRQESMSGFQQIVTYKDIEEKFDITFSVPGISVSVVAQAVVDELETHEEVADVELDEDGFDVVLYTDYAPNYDSKQYE